MKRPKCFGRMDSLEDLPCGECDSTEACYDLTFADIKDEEEKGPTHTLHIRKLDHDTYETLWNLRKAHGAGSWAKLMKKIVGEYVEMVKREWI